MMRSVAKQFYPPKPVQVACPLVSRINLRIPSGHGVHRVKLQTRTAVLQTADVELTHTTSSTSENAAPSDFQRLISWVETSGGFVHPALELVDNAPCGCRGVIVNTPISVDDLHAAPLLLVPERLYMTSQAAQAHVSEMVSDELLQVFRSLPGPVQLALFLAIHQQYGSGSFWYPYISNLPDDPPCAWWWSESELRQYIKNYELPAEWVKQITGFRETAMQQLQALTNRFGVLHLSDTAAAWSYAQVLSRCFGNANNVGLAPFIDLLNHSSRAATPDGVELDGEQFVYITSTNQGEPRPLQAGDEVYISYIRKCDPYKTLLNFGFIPPEMLPKPKAQSRLLQPFPLFNLSHQSC